MGFKLSSLFPAMRPKLNDGWMSVVFAADRFDFAHIRRLKGQKPEVLLLKSVQRSDDDANVLSALRKPMGLDHYRCSNLLRMGEYKLLQVELPAVPAAEIKEALRWSVKDLIDFPVESATLDMVEIPRDSGAAGKSNQALAVVADNALLASRMEMFDDANVPLEAIDIPEMALRNISALYEEADCGLATLCFDNSGVTLIFTFHGELYSSRHTDIPLGQLEKAEGGRREQLFERIALEAQRSLDNFDRLNSHIRMSRLMVSPLPTVPGLVVYLGAYFSLPVVEIDLADVLDFRAIPELSNPVNQAQYLKTLGAALRD